MKTVFLLIAFTFCSVLAFSAKTTITNAGTTFTPDSVTVGTNDTVLFQIASIHNVVEVSQATWNANGNTPLAGGFSLPFGGGQLTGFTAGMHYYVCAPHASLGMKGRIFVTLSSGINNPKSGSSKVSIFPNPTNGKFTIRDQYAGLSGNTNQETTVNIYDVLGHNVIAQTGLQLQTGCEFDISSYPEGIYYIILVKSKKTRTVKLIKK